MKCVCISSASKSCPIRSKAGPCIPARYFTSSYSTTHSPLQLTFLLKWYNSHFLFIESFLKDVQLRVGKGQLVRAVHTTLQDLGEEEGG